MTSSFHRCKGCTKCNQSPKHSNTQECLRLRVSVTNWHCCPFVSFPFFSHFASRCSPSKLYDTPTSFYLPQPSLFSFMSTSSRWCGYLIFERRLRYVMCIDSHIDSGSKSFTPLLVSWDWTITILPSNKKQKHTFNNDHPAPFFPSWTCQGAPCCRISAVNLLMAWSTSPRWTGPWSLITWTKGWWWIRMVQCDIQKDRRLRDGPAMHHTLCAPESPTVGLQVSLGCKGKVECLHDLNTT